MRTTGLRTFESHRKSHMPKGLRGAVEDAHPPQKQQHLRTFEELRQALDLHGTNPFLGAPRPLDAPFRFFSYWLLATGYWLLATLLLHFSARQV
jgi:hypothetical protein